MDVNLLLNAFLVVDWAMTGTATLGLLGVVGVRGGRYTDALRRVRMSH